MEIQASAPDPLNNSISFGFKGVSPSLFNVIRHAVFKDVPVLAVDTVTFIQYDGPLESEMISHRIGQLPLRFKHGTATDIDTATFEINVTAPPAGTKCGLTWVTSTDIKCTSDNAEVVHYRSDAEQELAKGDDGFLIAPLHPSQRIYVTFQARVSTAREKTRWVSCHTTVKPEQYVLKVETTGAITPREALTEALKSTLHRLNSLSSNLDR